MHPAPSPIPQRTHPVSSRVGCPPDVPRDLSASTHAFRGLNPHATIGLFEFIEIQEQLSEALGRKVDLLTPQSLSKYFRNEVLKQAELVYGV